MFWILKYDASSHKIIRETLLVVAPVVTFEQNCVVPVHLSKT
jgi:hypothetical protein